MQRGNPRGQSPARGRGRGGGRGRGRGRGNGGRGFDNDREIDKEVRGESVTHPSSHTTKQIDS